MLHFNSNVALCAQGAVLGKWREGNRGGKYDEGRKNGMKEIRMERRKKEWKEGCMTRAL